MERQDRVRWEIQAEIQEKKNGVWQLPARHQGTKTCTKLGNNHEPHGKA